MTGHVNECARVALVTGASRGIGAETVRQLGRRGVHVIVNYREKCRRAEAVVEEICAAGGTAAAIRADLTDPVETQGMLDEIGRTRGRLDVLVLNASGGLEQGAPPEYAMRLNRDAQLTLVQRARPLIPRGGRIVFVTSHQAHFSGRKPVPDGYAPIAASKRAGEDALRAIAPELDSVGIGFVTVSGDMIDGTIIVRLLERRDHAAVDARRAHGALPTVDEFAAGIVDAAYSDVPSGHTVYIGGGDYLTELGAQIAATDMD